MNLNINPVNRLRNEYQFCSNDSDLVQLGCSFGLENNNLFVWNVSILGPQDTPYADGLFFIRIVFPMDYPAHGPEFLFTNKIYHLNVNFTDSIHYKKGHICLSSLNEWATTGKVAGKNVYGVKQALIDIFCLFSRQGQDSPFSPDMANLYASNPAEFNRIAKEWTQQYAKMSN